MIHHLLSHSDTRRLAEGQPVLHASRSPTSRSKLDAIQEGERTLLDNSMILYLLEHDDRQPRQRPAAGRAARPRRRADQDAAACSTTSASPNRKMCSLYLSLMDKAGVHLDEFGDSSERLAEI